MDGAKQECIPFRETQNEKFLRLAIMFKSYHPEQKFFLSYGDFSMSEAHEGFGLASQGHYGDIPADKEQPSMLFDF